MAQPSEELLDKQYLAIALFFHRCRERCGRTCGQSSPFCQREAGEGVPSTQHEAPGSLRLGTVTCRCLPAAPGGFRPRGPPPPRSPPGSAPVVAASAAALPRSPSPLGRRFEPRLELPALPLPPFSSRSPRKPSAVSRRGENLRPAGASPHSPHTTDRHQLPSDAPQSGGEGGDLYAWGGVYPHAAEVRASRLASCGGSGGQEPVRGGGRAQPGTGREGKGRGRYSL